MDIEEFYQSDERRRASEEVEFGRDWHDGSGGRYELSWVADTGELYVMREPVPSGWATPFGGIHGSGAHGLDEHEVQGMTVGVVGRVETREAVERILSGWQEAMEAPNGIAWLAERLRDAGVLPAGSPSATP